MFRPTPPPSPPGDERKDLFGPVADLMVGVIFIFILLLIGLALHLQPEDYQRLRDRVAALEAANERLTDVVRYVRDHQIKDLLARLAAASETRARLLEDLQQRLQALGIQVTIDPANGTLRLPSGGLFLAGQSQPTPLGRDTIRSLGAVLTETLPCYAGATALPGCPKTEVAARLSAAYVEGHTDVVPVSQSAGRFRDNWDLSAARAIETFKLLRETHRAASRSTVVV